MNSKAIIYCRVSSQKQVVEGTGNQSQEQRCREYCLNKKYLVQKVFVDDGVSGGLFERPAMKNLIQFLDNKPTENFIVVFDDLSRFARDVLVYIKLKKELIDRGCKLECPNFNFDESEEGEVMELMTAVFNQYDRKKNRRQVIQKQKARLERGYWCFCLPQGLKYEKRLGEGKVIVNSEPIASIYKEAIEKYANSFFKTQIEVREFILKEYSRYGINRKLSINGTKRILSELLYTGYLEFKNWGVAKIQAKHKGFITYQTYLKVQSRFKEFYKNTSKSKYNKDFPLRGLVLCSKCNKPFTASWNKGRNKYYANYFCKQCDCDYKWKSISKERLERDFEQLLSNFGKIKPVYLDLAKEVLMDVWSTKVEQLKTNNKCLNEELEAIEERINILIERYSTTVDKDIASILEEKIINAKKQKEIVVGKLKNPISNIYTKERFGTDFDKVKKVLENPLETWKEDNLENKRSLVNLYFENLPKYDLQNGFGIATFSCGVNLIKGLETKEYSMVEMRRS